MATNNAVPSNVKEDNVEAEIIKGEQDDILEDYPKSVKEKIQEKSRLTAPSTLPSKIVKRDVSQIASKSTSTRIKKLAQPTKKRVLTTLHDKALTLSPMFVDNLIKIIEAESCLTPEEAAQVLRRKKRRSKKVTRSPIFIKKWEKESTKVGTVEATTLERDATMCQYLIAECFVKSILGYQCQSQKKDIREIAQVILKRLTSLDGYTDTRNDDRAMQQLRLLADIVACWIAEILIEVAETRKEALEEYCEKRQMKMMEVDDDDDQINSKIEEQMKQKKVTDKTVQEEKKWAEREDSQLNEREIENNDARNEIGNEEKQKNEINIKKEKEEEINKIDEREDEEINKIDERKDEEKKENKAEIEE